jgi:hypothetical protein
VVGEWFIGLLVICGSGELVIGEDGLVEMAYFGAKYYT